MTPRTIAAILIYIFIALVAYVIVRVLEDLDDDGSAVLIAWAAAVFWPAFAALVLVSVPFWLVGTGIDKIIYNVQTRILEAKCRKIKAKE